MARNLIGLLEAEGAEVLLASELRLHEKKGDPTRQAELRRQADAELSRLEQELPEISLWVTYHNYYKAPDLIGPQIARARGIPYVQIESTRAQKRLTGSWAGFAQAAHAAADAADLIFYLTEQDRFALERDRASAQTLAHLPPFLPKDNLPAQSALDGPMLAAGMMREGDKLASYRLIADALGALQRRKRAVNWQLLVAGDGPARAEIEALFAPFGTQVTLLGQLSRAALEEAYGKACLFLWPGVNEAFGMVYLEAQSHGLPVVAQDRPGLRDVLAQGHYPPPEQGAEGLADRIETLLLDRKNRETAGQSARSYVAETHLANAARDQLWCQLMPLLNRKATAS